MAGRADSGDGLAPLPTDLRFEVLSPPHDSFADSDSALEDVPPLYQATNSIVAPPNNASQDVNTSSASANPAAEAKDEPASRHISVPSNGESVSQDDEKEDDDMDMDIDAEGEEEPEEAVEEVEERPEVNADLFGILQSLRYEEEEVQEEVEETIEEQEDEVMPETALSSPLSDLPDLPTEFPPSPPRPRSPTPPPSPETMVKKVSPARQAVSLPAETSASGAKRAASPELMLERVSKKVKSTAAVINNKVAGKRSPSPNSTKGKGKEEEEDDLCSINGDEVEPALKTVDEIKELKQESLVTDDKPRGPKSPRSDGQPKEERKIIRKPRKKKQPAEEGEPSSAPVNKKRKKLDPISYQPRNGDIPEKIVPRPNVLNFSQMKAYLKGKTKEVQIGPCLRPRYAKFRKCTQCVSKIGGDSCRFRDYRVFPIDPDTTEIIGLPTFESTEWKDEFTTLPEEFNVDFTEDHMKRIERTAAPVLLPIITRELRHVVRNEAITRESDAAKHRAVCDFCSSTIFGGWFFCKNCGKDYCLSCERYFAEAAETMEESPWHLPPAARPRLLRCAQANIPGSQSKRTLFHFRPDLQPVSRFSEEELRTHWLCLAEFVLHSEGNVGERLKLLGLSNANEEQVSQMQDWLVKMSQPLNKPPPPLSDEAVQKLYSKSTNSNAEVIPDPAKLEEKSHPFIFIDDKDLSLDVFDQLWAKGEPIIVDKVGDNFKMSWTPDDFIERFGKEVCYIVECQTNKTEKKTVERFFERFKDRENRTQAVLKLKDWPQTADFKSTHPALYNDFCDALPAPDYTRREGVLNLYSHFPPGPTRPDIGPKMYNAFAAKQTQGGQGSTRLHMDVADAVNVMLYASPRSDGQPGCAVWDLFRAQDADKIRAYLKYKFDKTHPFTDPIHSQHFYLDSSRRKELAEKYGVVSWRVYQYPGQAVFIPAGCAHQVCNLADCIKIALDFVSPHNVYRCQQLTQDFRTENFYKIWKEDVLQLYNVLWYAWTNVAETRKRRKIEARQQAEEARARAARLELLQKGEHGAETVSAVPFTPGYGDRHRLGGLLGSAVSSIRDEENPRSPTMAQSRGSTPTKQPDGQMTNHNASTPTKADANGENPVEAEDVIMAEHDKIVKAENMETTPKKSRTADFAEKLLNAALLASEPPPPPEARAPSAGSKWGPGAPKVATAGPSRSKAKAAKSARSSKSPKGSRSPKSKGSSRLPSVKTDMVYNGDQKEAPSGEGDGVQKENGTAEEDPTRGENQTEDSTGLTDEAKHSRVNDEVTQGPDVREDQAMRKMSSNPEAKLSKDEHRDAHKEHEGKNENHEEEVVFAEMVDDKDKKGDKGKEHNEENETGRPSEGSVLGSRDPIHPTAAVHSIEERDIAKDETSTTVLGDTSADDIQDKGHDAPAPIVLLDKADQVNPAVASLLGGQGLTLPEPTALENKSTEAQAAEDQTKTTTQRGQGGSPEMQEHALL